MGYRNLVPGQYQIGNLVFGHGTNIIVENFEAKPYDQNVSDYQVSRTDEMRFGFDQIKPTTIEITMSVLYNRLLDQYAGSIPNFWAEMPTVSDLATEWRSDDIRYVWGQMKELYYCGKDGVGKVIYGRPGQFGAEKPSPKETLVKCVGEFRRADVLNYSVTEYITQLTSNASPQYLTRVNGDTDSWLRIIGQGPLTNPVITIGDQQIGINETFAAGESFEISSYPWQRRAIDHDRVNLASKLTGSYLDKIKIPYNVPIPVRWTSAEVNTWVPYTGNRQWTQDIDNFGLLEWQVPSDTYTTLRGRVVIGMDIINPHPFKRYLKSGIFQNTSAVIYSADSFATGYQYSEAQVVHGMGRTGIVILSNDTMTNYAVMEIFEAGTSRGLRLRTGSSPTTWSAVRTSWDRGGLWWSENDRVGIGYNPATSTFQMYFNGSAVGTPWVDSSHIVNQSNRKSGYIFDMDGNLLTSGIGLRSMVSYDNQQVPADTGKIYLLWRDAWGAIE